MLRSIVRAAFVLVLACGAATVAGVRRENRLPQSDHHLQRVQGYVEERPVEEYRWASEEAYEAFADMKYGIRIHWGVYALRNLEASWPLLGMDFKGKAAYEKLYQQFNPKDFDAEAWMRMFERNGLKMFAFTTKHHDGFCMFDTATRVKQRVNWAAPEGPQLEACDVAYSVMETPYGRDIVKELCDAAHRHGIKIDLYFSHPDWYDADFRPYNYHSVQTPEAKAHPERYGHAPATGPHMMASDPTAEEVERMVLRHRRQLEEIVTKYGKIDMVCLDQWLGSAVWPQMRETMLVLRQAAPETMFRARGIGNYGDYYTPEGFVPGDKENTNVPWFVIYPLGGMFAYQSNGAAYKGGDWIVTNVIDATAKRGNFMVAIGPDADGKWHPKALEALDYAGDWLRVNGEAIYATRARAGDLWKEGEAVRFTRSKDKRTIYAISMNHWPGRELVLKSVAAEPGSEIRMLGYGEPLAWWEDELRGLVIEIPEALQDASGRPCKQAWAFKIQGHDVEIARAPQVMVQSKPLADVEQVSLVAQDAASEIRYTLDGSEPTAGSQLYGGPVELRAGATLKARAFRPGARASELVSFDAGAMRVNFQPANVAAPAGFLADTGEVFGQRASGLEYGWSKDHKDETRKRNEESLDGTFCHFRQGQFWQVSLPDGRYGVTVAVGDAGYDSNNTVNVAGVSFCRNRRVSKSNERISKEVEVTGGSLKIDCGDSKDRETKLSYVEIVRAQ